MPLVSIVTRAYKRAALLEHTLETLSKQTFKDFEVVVVEDGNDGEDTRRLCETFRLQVPIRYFQRSNRPNLLYSNPSIPNNIGLRNAVGEIVVPQNAGCMFCNDDGLETLIGLVEDTNAVFPTSLGSGRNKPQSHRDPQSAHFGTEASRLVNASRGQLLLLVQPVCKLAN